MKPVCLLTELTHCNFLNSQVLQGVVKTQELTVSLNTHYMVQFKDGYEFQMTP